MENTILVPQEGKIIVHGKDNKCLFAGTQKELIKFIEDAMYIAECIAIDIESGNIEDDELGTLAFDVYKDYSKYYSNNIGLSKRVRDLFDQANQEDNDLKYMGLFKKAQREKRWEVFQETVVPVLVERNISYHFSQEKYSYTFSSSEHGNVDFFVKANKVHIRVLNKWIEGNAIQWLFKHIINK